MNALSLHLDLSAVNMLPCRHAVLHTHTHYFFLNHLKAVGNLMFTPNSFSLHLWRKSTFSYETTIQWVHPWKEILILVLSVTSSNGSHVNISDCPLNVFLAVFLFPSFSIQQKITHCSQWSCFFSPFLSSTFLPVPYRPMTLTFWTV